MAGKHTQFNQQIVPHMSTTIAEQLADFVVDARWESLAQIKFFLRSRLDRKNIIFLITCLNIEHLSMKQR
jgi:hypothetical protein